MRPTDPARSHPAITAVATASPPFTLDQEAAKRLAGATLARHLGRSAPRLLTSFDNSGVEQRQLCVPPEWLAQDHSIGTRNDLYGSWATELSTEAAGKAMAAAGCRPDEVAALVFVSSTGVAMPSIDAELLLRLGLPARHTHRYTVFGRGCAGGAAGLGLAGDLAMVHPGRAVLLVVTELCSLSFRVGDTSSTNLVSAALFGDGAAAAVVQVGGDGPRIIGHDAVTWPGTAHAMGWRLGDHGFEVELDRGVPRLLRREFAPSATEACAHLGIEPDGIIHHLVHPGSARILDIVEETMSLSADALGPSRHVLRVHGNMSAATILFVLERAMATAPAASGDVGLLSAVGPGFSAEHVGLTW
jgi:alkylresorcinol/alkylpyrone synthase